MEENFFSKQLAALSRDGYTVLTNILSSAECTKFKCTLESIYATYRSRYYSSRRASSHGLDDKSGEKIVYNLHNKDLAFFDLLGHSQVLPIIKAILQEGSYENSGPVIHTLSTARSPFATAKAQQLHTDSRMPGTPYATNAIAMWLLDDFTIENGATRLVPGSHRRPFFPENDVSYPDEVSVVAPAGSVLIFNASVWHGGGVKVTDTDRWACVFTYGRWYLKPSFDFNRNMPSHIYKELNDEMRELLGYKVCPPIDEFTRGSTRSEEFETPENYDLPSL